MIYRSAAAVVGGGAKQGGSGESNGGVVGEEALEKLRVEDGEGREVVLDVGREQREEGNGEAAQCIWLARVRPEDCENIVRYTILQGKVVKPKSQLRGGFDRGKQLVSW